ncbi:hypothetical protein CALVIDRAFT_548101 [Calocera viscosa TUFC12733]|uniref:Multiple myeloma tumor-associated protein 2-like N-terminal domain-containing protein n=1 Tax=Calocera viscosa (strain TUFC12733) TaxID=1330018 RepID=A0A167RTN6_CALVF|nr:hypothetical protein CALVIDRAFT_548101 [Calocera viscosa TUFC12733]
MYNGPIRGGTRGGAAEFKWTDVATDKDRENYLGHSVNAPAGRWQKNKDIHWYSRDIEGTEEEKREEIRKVKEAEEDALAIALYVNSRLQRRGANTSHQRVPARCPRSADRRGVRTRERGETQAPPRRRDRSPDRDRNPHDRRTLPRDPRDARDERRTDYDEEEMRKEPERDRRRWEANAERDRPGRREGERWERGRA